MLVRALIVLLCVLNAGVAAWWIARDPVPPPAPVNPPSGVARLQLVSEAGMPTPTTAAAAAAAPAPTTATAPGLSSAPVAQQCASFGPFASRQAADAAAAKLRPMAQKVAVREQGGAAAPRGWRVFLPAAASLAEAQAAAARIGAAGFTDFIVVREGAEANSVALGRYRNEEGARNRAKALNDAGFAARVEAVGQTAVSAAWIDVVADESFDPRRAQATVDAAQRHALDCAQLR